MQMAGATADYPVQLELAPPPVERNRLTVGFRLILAIPHMILVGGGGLIGGSFSNRGGSPDDFGGLVTSIISTGILSMAAGVCSIISWFAILFTGTHPQSLWDFELWVLRWQTRANAYIYLLRDEYPPFGEADYPVEMRVAPPATRDRVSVGFRIFLLIPHIIILIFLGFAWLVTTIIAWFAILFTGLYPQSLYDFGVGVFRWQTRVTAYGYLLRDEYPPFALN